MTVQTLRMRLYEGDRRHESWEEACDPDSAKALRLALIAAIEAHGVCDPRETLPRFHLEYQTQTGGWRAFRAAA